MLAALEYEEYNGEINVNLNNMKKFLGIYMMPTLAMDEARKTSTPEKQKEEMASWGKWMESIKGSTVDGGAPTGKNIRVNSQGMNLVRNEVCGYIVVEAETIEDAAKLFEGNPMLAMSEAYVEVAECMSM